MWSLCNDVVRMFIKNNMFLKRMSFECSEGVYYSGCFLYLAEATRSAQRQSQRPNSTCLPVLR